MIRPRWVAKCIAHLGGYFWLPCPICAEPFAGFEWGENQSLMKSLTTGVGVCNKTSCKAEARRRNEELYAKLGTRIVSAGS